MPVWLKRFFPFLQWFPLRRDVLRADLMAGIAVALVLIPQSMAYAQLAQLPPVYGLYASFLPVMVAVLWGSSNQLATGPVAVVSLLTASALVPLATAGSAEFVALAIALAAMVGLIQLLLGVLRLGALVSFISHPVIVGFTNAAALIIGLSQLNKLLGMQRDSDGSFMSSILDMLLRINHAHLPTVLMGLGAIALMWGLRRYYPRAPGVLIAVLLATLVSWAIGYERQTEITLDKLGTAQVVELVRESGTKLAAAEAREAEARKIEAQLGEHSGTEALLQRHQSEMLRYEAEALRNESADLKRTLRRISLRRADSDAELYFVADAVPSGVDVEGRAWRIVRTDNEHLVLSGGGDVVGVIPAGLPELSMPTFDWRTFTSLITSALIISLVGFMEAIAIAKAIAAKTGQRLDPNQELVGQGLANLAGSVSQAYPVSGSFSRSAVNLSSGAKTGMSSVVTAILVLVTLLFLTPLLYHLPQAVLAAIIMMAVAGLINVKAIKHAWEASRHDGFAAVATFVVTLVMAPNLDLGILAGVGLALVLYLYRSMRPRVSVLARYADGTLREARRYGLMAPEKVCVIRFDGALYFANVPYFEDAVLDVVARNPQARYVVIVAKGINEIDASGEEVVRHLVQRLRERDVRLVFAGIKAQVLEVMQRTGLYDEIGKDFVFRSTESALSAVYEWSGDESLLNRSAVTDNSGRSSS